MNTEEQRNVAPVVKSRGEMDGFIVDDDESDSSGGGPSPPPPTVDTVDKGCSENPFPNTYVSARDIHIIKKLAGTIAEEFVLEGIFPADNIMELFTEEVKTQFPSTYW